MMGVTGLSILPADLLSVYMDELKQHELAFAFDALCEAEISTPDFSFYTSVASVFSSKIEGEKIELDTYLKHKKFGLGIQADHTRKVDDLYEAYIFSRDNKLNKTNAAHAHKLISRNILEETWQGVFRNQQVYITTADGRIEYVAAQPSEVPAAMEKLLEDIDILLLHDCAIEEVFFFASMIHLVFVKIHPWSDGNGRSARLLEKWFLAEKLGAKAWFLQSEKYYYENHQEYYHNIRKIGLEYKDLNYAQALDFLLMLPAAFTTNSHRSDITH
jgi:Fic family protein